jgi:uncharacterized membrane protein YgdD (TMEM256/DUF423 family)
MCAAKYDGSVDPCGITVHRSSLWLLGLQPYLRVRAGNPLKRLFILTGCVFAFLAVALGAFGAHALKQVLDQHMLQVYRTAVEYQQFHALGLIMTGLLCGQKTSELWLRIAGFSMITGIILFSGSLYLLSVSGLTGFAIITPFGGLAFLVGWFCLAVSACRIS